MIGMLALGHFSPAWSATAVFDAGMDFFNYGNAPSGTSTSVPVFAFLNSDDPDRLGQMVLGFETSAQVTPGLGASNYQVTSARLYLNLQNSLIYDPTYDSVATYLIGGVDADPGRPFELYALGLRDGYTGVGFDPQDPGPPLFSESSPYEPAGSPAGAYAPYAYPRSFGSGVGRADGDVIDSVSEGWETEPLALGLIDGISPGDATAANSRVVFSLNVSDPSVLTYLQNSLDAGAVGLNVASLHAASGIGTGSYPRFSTREHPTPALRPLFEIDVIAVPEPGVPALLLGAGLAVWLRRRRTHPS